MTEELKRKTVGRLSLLRGGSGPALVLLHGIPGSAYSWEGVGERLTDRFDVIIPDLAGFGMSKEPPGDYYMEAQAAALRALLEELGIASLYLGGHDFGGPVAITFLRMFPEIEVRGLLLSATNLFTDTFVPVPLRAARIPLLGQLVFHLMAGNKPAFWMMHKQAARNKEVATWDRFARHLTPGGMRLTRKIFHRSLADLKANYSAVQGFLGGLELPTTVVWGDSDPFFAVEVGERTRDAIPGARLEVYPRTGHFVPEEQPELLAADLRNAFAS